MTIDKIKEKIETSEEYAFLRKEPLASQVILLGLGGSYAYGTNVETSDIDIRGIATHNAHDILTGKGFEQITEENTDTVVYSLRKIVNLLENCNPNTIEMLGLEPWQYLKVTDAGQKLIDNASLFLSKRAVRSFGGYANAQLWRLKQKAIRGAAQKDQEEHILNSIESARYSFPEKYFDTPEDSIHLYTDKAVNEELDMEIFMDLNLKHYPLRDYVSMWEEMKNIAKSYNKIGARNSKAIEHGKLTKHMMHLVRLYLMAFDILEDGKIVTYRRKEHDFLMDIRNGKYLVDEQPTEEFYDIVRDYEDRLKTASEKTPLPKNPDYEKIDRLVEEINMEVIEKNRTGSKEKTVIPCRISFANVLEPKTINGRKPTYSVVCIFPKDDRETLSKLNRCIATVKNRLLSTKNLNETPPIFRIPIQDGDIRRPDEKEYQNMFFLFAKSEKQPTVTDCNNQSITDKNAITSGCRCNVGVTMYEYSSNGITGIAAELESVQILDTEKQQKIQTKTFANQSNKNVIQQAKAGKKQDHLYIKEQGVDIVIKGTLRGLPIIIDKYFDTEKEAEQYLKENGC